MKNLMFGLFMTLIVGISASLITLAAYLHFHDAKPATAQEATQAIDAAFNDGVYFGAVAMKSLVSAGPTNIDLETLVTRARQIKINYEILKAQKGGRASRAP